MDPSNSKPQFKFTKKQQSNNVQNKTEKYEKKDNFNVSETIKYYNEFTLKFHKIEEDLKSFENQINNEAFKKEEKLVQLETINESIKLIKDDFLINAQFMTNYDKSNYLNQLENLSQTYQELKEKLSPKKKFAFSNRTTNKASVTETQLTNNFKRETININLGSAPEVQPEIENDVIIAHNQNLSNENDLLVSNHDNQKLILEENDHLLKSNLIIENITNCEIYILFNFKACYIKNVTNSKIYLGSINGGTHINDCQNCEFFLATHQLRIHKTKQTLFSILVSSNPIIEHCSELRFSPLSINYKNKEINFRNAGLVVEKNKWNQVLDFQWLKKEKSPNFDCVEEFEIYEIQF